MNNPGVVDSNQKIVGSGLLLNIDAAQRRSYPTKGTTWTDLSGNNRNGTLTNSPTYSSTNGGIFSFSTNQYINFGNTLDNDGTSPFSVSVWFRNTSTLTGVQVLASKQIISPPYTGWNFSFNPTATLAGVGRLQIEMVTNTTQIMRINTSTTYNNGNWYNAVFTYNGSKTRAGMLLYINGSLISTNGTDSASVTNTMSNAANYEIGARNGANQPYYGNIANAIHYNRVLSATEVLNNFNAIKSRFGYPNESIVTDGLVLNLNAGNTTSYSGSGTSWFDLSGNNNTGTLINGPTFNSANGGSIVFDGTNDYGQIAHTTLLNPTLSMTLSAWINVSSFVPFMSIFGKGTTTNGSGGFDFRIDSSTNINLVKYFIIDQGVTISALSTNTWYNIVAVQSSTKVDYYINGVNVGSFSNSTAYQTNTAVFKIAADRSNIYTPAKIANVQIYNRVLSATEVLNNFNALRSRFGL